MIHVYLVIRRKALCS